MIESIEFTNFKALRKTTLPLSPFTLLLGPNGSGKTTVLQALQGVSAVARGQASLAWPSIVSVTSNDQIAPVEIKVRLRLKNQPVFAVFQWHSQAISGNRQVTNESASALTGDDVTQSLNWVGRIQTYALDFAAIASPVQVHAGVTLQPNGAGLAAVLDDLRNNNPERWDSLLKEMCEWLPEYDYVLFDTPQQGSKCIALRTKKGRHRIPARDLSQGTLVALALLTLAHLPAPPSVIGLEEIDRGLHPRLLRHLQDALYRLSYPESCGEKRPPIQVIATTHSPYLLDLYRDHPEEVVLAQKEGLEVQFKRLSEIEHFDDVLGDSPLSEVWYSGVLGGVSVKP